MDDAFKLWWPKLKLSIDNIPKVLDEVKRNERTEREMIEELLILVRRMARRSVPPVVSSRYIVENDLDDLPPPPDNFPSDWDTEWQPSFENAEKAAEAHKTPKASKTPPIPRKKTQ